MTVRTGCTTRPAENAISAASMASINSLMLSTARTSDSDSQRGIAGHFTAVGLWWGGRGTLLGPSARDPPVGLLLWLPHPELEYAPIFFMGHSNGGAMSVAFNQWLPSRVAGFVASHGAVGPGAHAGVLVGELPN